MTEPTLGDLYGEGSRALQDAFDSRRLADRLVELTVHEELTDADIELIEAQTNVLVSTVDEAGWPDVSYKGGDPGFVRVLDATTLALPSYDGNGMFRTLGNIAADPRLALLFVDTARPWRLRLHGLGRVETEGQLVESFHGAQAVAVVEVKRVFPNCGRYIDQGTGPAPHVPRKGEETPEPEWKQIDAIRRYLPGKPTEHRQRRARTQRATTSTSSASFFFGSCASPASQWKSTGPWMVARWSSHSPGRPNGSLSPETNRHGFRSWGK